MDKQMCIFQLEYCVLCANQSRDGGAPVQTRVCQRDPKSVTHSPPHREQAHEEDGAGESIRVKITSQDVNHTTGIVGN